MREQNRHRKSGRIIVLLLVGLLLMVGLAFAFSQRRQNHSQQVRPRRATTLGSNTITVKAGGRLQAALDSAQPGDTIVLEAGATYSGLITLPNKTGSSYITIQSSRLAELPANRRVTPEDAAKMPKIVAPGGNTQAIITAAGAHHYRFLGIEFMPKDERTVVTNLIQLNPDRMDTPSKVPHHIEFDRCYVHAWPDQEVRRGFALNSADTSITNSHISGFKQRGGDTQAIMGWLGPGPYRIINNYLEGAGENVMFGGNDPLIPNLVPSDIEIRRNHFAKPVSWRGLWEVKNLLELKNARRVTIDGNLFEYNWAHGQVGFAIGFSPMNQDDTAPWSTVEDVEFTNNIVRHATAGMSLLGKDPYGETSLQMKRILIRNNLFYDLNRETWSGSYYALQVAETDYVTFDHNTILHADSLMFAHGQANTNFVFTNNIAFYGAYGIWGDGSGATGDVFTDHFPGGVFNRNVIIWPGANPDRFPADNYLPETYEEVGLAADYRLEPTSPYTGGATDGTDVGCDMTALEAAIFGVTSPK